MANAQGDPAIALAHTCRPGDTPSPGLATLKPGMIQLPMSQRHSNWSARASQSCAFTALIAGGLVIPTGCVRRTISITSEPAGALVHLNHREIGRTPVEVEFIYYGDYDVRLVKDGYEPLIVKGDASAPLWDTPPFDLVAEAVPDARKRIHWHYQLAPIVEDPAALVERAQAIRIQLAADIAESGIDVAIDPEEEVETEPPPSQESSESGPDNDAGPGDDGP